MGSGNVIYAVRLERVSYGQLQILRVKIGHTNDIDRRLRTFKNSHANAEILDLWKPNEDLPVNKCEEGIQDIAKNYAYQSEREIFTFLQDSYDTFSDTISGKILEPIDPQDTAQSSSGTTQVTEDKYVVEFSDGHQTSPADDQTSAMIEATNYLINNYDLIQKINIPWVPGRTKAIINDTKIWDEADPKYKKLENGYYVDTKLSSHGKEREIKRMATKCGLDVNFKGDW